MYNTCAMLSICFGLLVFQTAIYARQKNCPMLELPPLKDDTVGIFENDYVNTTFWLNGSGCKQSDTIYKLTVTIKTNNGDSEEAGHLTVTNDACMVIDRESLHCVSPVGPVLLYRRVDRSHAEMEWEWHWKDGSTFINDNRIVKLNVSYPPSVTYLTVEAQEVKGHYVINKSQRVIIVCSFDKGNPPATFHLLDENRRELHDVTRAERELIHSLPAGQCEQPWPVVRCEAQGSSENRSVTFLVRCPPQFMDMGPKQIDPDVDEPVMFTIKAHTREVAACLLTSKSLGETCSREVNCSLSGNPPDLFLTLHLQKKDRSIRENWTLTVSNEIGAGNTRVIFKQHHGGTTESFENNITVCITIPICSVVLIIAAMVCLAMCTRRKKRRAAAGTGATDDSSDHRDDAQRHFPNMQAGVIAGIVVAVVAVTVAVMVAVICFLRRRGSRQLKAPPSPAGLVPPVHSRPPSHALLSPAKRHPVEERVGGISLESEGEVNQACDVKRVESVHEDTSPSPGRRSSSGSSEADQYENTPGPGRQSSSHSSSYGDYVEADDSDPEDSSSHSANTHNSGSNSKKNDSSSRKNLPNGFGNNGGYMSMQTKNHDRPLSEDMDSRYYEEPNAQLPSPPCLSTSPCYVNLSPENLPLEQVDHAETVSSEYENSTVMKLAANLKSYVLMSIPTTPVTTGVQSKVHLKPVSTSVPRNPDSAKVESSAPKHSVEARVQTNVPLNPIAITNHVDNGVPQNSVGASAHSGVPRNPAAASSHRTVPENSEHTKPSPVLSKNVSRGPECSPKPQKDSAQPRSKDGGRQAAKRGNPEGACVVSVKPAVTQPVLQQALKPAGKSEGQNLTLTGQGKQSHSAAVMPPGMRATESQEPKSHHRPMVVEEESGEEDSDSESYENVQSVYENTPSKKQETGPPPKASPPTGREANRLATSRASTFNQHSRAKAEDRKEEQRLTAPFSFLRAARGKNGLC